LPHKTGNPLKRKHTWSREEEDDNLIQMVNLHGSKKNWSTVACGIPGRSPNQCRDRRWMFYLDPAVNNQPWSEQEDIELIQAHKIHGSQWCKLAKLFPGRARTGKAIKNHWPSLMRKQMKSGLVRELPGQFPCMPNDPLVTKNKGSSTINSGQDSSTNIPVSPDLPVTVRPKSEQGLPGNCKNESTLKRKGDSTHGKGSASHSVKVSEKVDGQIDRSNSASSVDQKVSCATASFPGSLPKEESTNFLEVAPDRGFSPAYNHLSNNDRFKDICSNADPESQELHVSNIADLLDMSYCESLMIVPPDSPNHGNSTDGM
ncbi:hypothetical protein BAE44_0006017, partial [Dichanthelium oligosanthes]